MGHVPRMGDGDRVRPDVKPRTIRLDDATWTAAEEYARRRGLNSAAEYFRQAVISMIAWDRAMEAIQQGGDASQLRDVELIGRMLERIADDEKSSAD